VKIVHTADVHLSEQHPERIEALKQILQMCEERDADLLLISGDLFDNNIDVEDLKTDLRSLFKDNSFQTYIIPGNHDATAFRQEDYFGEDIEVLSDVPYEQRKIDEVNLVAVPFTEKDFSEIKEELPETSNKNKIDLMMIHCTLSGSQGGFGNEEKYMPVKPSQIIQTDFDYILSGHIHSSATRKTFGNTTFAYPGSPVSISSTETGRRAVWMLDTEEESMETIELDTEYFLRKELEIMPDREEEVKEELIAQLEDRDLEKATIILNIHGYTEKDVEELIEQLREELEELNPDEIRIGAEELQSVSSLVESSLYQDFMDKMREENLNKPEEVERKFLKGLARHER